MSSCITTVDIFAEMCSFMCSLSSHTHLPFQSSLPITGRLALKLCDKKGLSAQKSIVIMFAHGTILWASEPLQSSANAHLIGQKCGQQSGDFLYASINWISFIVKSYVAGQSIDSDCSGELPRFHYQNAKPRPQAITWLCYFASFTVSCIERRCSCLGCRSC